MCRNNILRNLTNFFILNTHCKPRLYLLAATGWALCCLGGLQGTECPGDCIPLQQRQSHSSAAEKLPYLLQALSVCRL